MITSLDLATLRNMFLAGAKNLEANKAWINELNVFPVPDGDTGTNMTLTIMSAAKEVAAIEELEMKPLCKAISSGSLRGARGNSGVILSQLFRGFTKEIKGCDEIDALTISKACERAVESAYKAVMKPKEGTILTVAKAISDRASEVVLETDDIDLLIQEAIKAGDYALSQTPEMLPVLKQAGVVDSGGQGLMAVIKGAYDGLNGKTYNLSSFSDEVKSEEEETAEKFKYDTNLTVSINKLFDNNKEKDLKKFLDAVGTSVNISVNKNIMDIHISTNEPGQVLTKALGFGDLTKIDIKNTVDAPSAPTSTTAPIEKEAPAKEVGFIAVSIGDGMNDILKGLGVDEIIEGGQTMNPSTDDVLQAISKVNAKTIYVLPNNKNIVLAANQAASITKDKEIVVIPSKNVPQGISAIIGYVQGQDVETNKESMLDAMANVKTGSVTYAVRDTVIDDKEIKENDIMGIGDDGIVSVGTDVKDTTVDMICSFIDENSEIISIYFGQDVTEDDAKEVSEAISEKYPDVEVDINYGGQPIYYYVVSVE